MIRNDDTQEIIRAKLVLFLSIISGAAGSFAVAKMLGAGAMAEYWMFSFIFLIVTFFVWRAQPQHTFKKFFFIAALPLILFPICLQAGVGGWTFFVIAANIFIAELYFKNATGGVK